MQFTFLFKQRQEAPIDATAGKAAMRQFAAELARQGKLRRGGSLVESGATVRVRDGQAFVVDGPFAESKEVVAGFWIVEAASREEAIDIARRCPHARHGIVEVHVARDRMVFADFGHGAPFLFMFRMEPGLGDPDGAKLREMIGYGQALKREGKLLETAPLAHDPPPLRIETRAGKVLVTDGPFAEAKEAVGGYGVIRVESRAAALDLAKQYPHAKWGPVEVREIGYLDPT